MPVRFLAFLLVASPAMTGVAHAQAAPRVTGAVAHLLNRVWRVTDAPSAPASGSVYVFLSNGTMLQTSCVETYRLATWKPDRKDPRTLVVTEDGQPAFSARVIEVTRTSLRLRQRLLRSKEEREIRLTAIDQEFVCPDRPR